MLKKKKFSLKVFPVSPNKLSCEWKRYSGLPWLRASLLPLSCSSLSQKEGMWCGWPPKSLNISCKLLLLETHFGLSSESLLISQNLISARLFDHFALGFARHGILLGGWSVGLMIPEAPLVSQQVPGAPHSNSKDL